VRIVRSPAVLLAFVATTVWSQDQDRRLIDRLLRPNMDLQNAQQGKVFRADSKVIARPGTAKTFLWGPVTKQKKFSDARVVETKEYRFHSIRANTGTNSFVETPQLHLPAQLATSSVHDLHPAYDAHRKVAGRNFVDTRAFREEGKSRKSLSRQNPSLTIDQVRELLNKNK
jgi:hypothetical protein